MFESDFGNRPEVAKLSEGFVRRAGIGGISLYAKQLNA